MRMGVGLYVLVVQVVVSRNVRTVKHAGAFSWSLKLAVLVRVRVSSGAGRWLQTRSGRRAESSGSGEHPGAQGSPPQFQ